MSNNKLFYRTILTFPSDIVLLQKAFGENVKNIKTLRNQG